MQGRLPCLLLGFALAITLSGEPAPRDQPEDLARYAFLNLTPASGRGYVLVPGYIDEDSRFRPWKNIVVGSLQIAAFDSARLRDAPFLYPGRRELGPAAVPPLRVLRSPKGAPGHYLLGVYMESPRVFFAFDVVRITQTAYRTLADAREAPPLVDDADISIVSIPAPPQYADFVRRVATIVVGEGHESQREIPIGAEIAIIRAPSLLRVGDDE